MHDSHTGALAEADAETGYADIDHLAHFVPDIEAAGVELTTLGFTLTPLSVQSHRLTPDAPLTPAGAANRCVMLRRGYLEFLTATHDTPNAARLRAAIERYTGVHLIAFGVMPPELPWIAGYVIDSDDLPESRAVTGGSAFGPRCLVKCAAAVGGWMLFQAADSGPLELD